MYALKPIGYVQSPLVNREHAPKQGPEGAPAAWLVFEPEFEDALKELRAEEDVLVLTWLHQADREILRVHPRDDLRAPLRGVFSTRSQDRFSDAEAVLYDSQALTREDPHARAEQRFVSIGVDGFGRILVVVYTHRGHDVRLTSAPPATRTERTCYEEGI